MPNNIQTSEILTAATSPEKLTLFPADFHANRFPLPGSDEAKQTTVRSGVKCFELYGQFAPLGLLAKTLLASSAWNSTRCLLTWKASATPAKRLLFRLVPSVQFTGETEFGLLPTPKAQSANSPGFYGNGGHDIQTTVAVMAGLLPTPTVNGNNNRKGLTPKSGDGLNTAIKRLLPTPQAGDGKTGDMGRNRNHGKQMNLETYLGNVFNRSNGSPTIHPTFYERLMGYPDGWTDVPPE